MGAVTSQPENRFGLSPPRPAQGDEPAAGVGPFNVLITGGSKGVGAALAAGFLLRGDSVCIAARSPETLERTRTQLAQYATGSASVHAVACDVSDPEAVETLLRHAARHLGRIDVVICNAGTNAYVYQPLADTPAAALEEVIRTNGLGTLLTCRAAIRQLRTQSSGGHVFVMKGAGSDGNPTRKYAAYGFSKAGMLQLAKSLSMECRDAQSPSPRGGPVGVHTLSPGLVYTELVDCGRDSFGKGGRFFVNAIAELPVDVAADLVPKLRAVAAQGAPAARQAPLEVEFLTPDKLLRKLYDRLLKGKNKDRFNPEEEPPAEGDRRVRLQWTPWLERPVETLVGALKRDNQA